MDGNCFDENEKVHSLFHVKKVNCEEVGDKYVNVCTYLRCENIFQTRVCTILTRGTQTRIQSSVEIGFFSKIAHFDNLQVHSKENKKVTRKDCPCSKHFQGWMGFVDYK